ncbi:MAG: NAD(P)H-binding protein [Actinomycetota bacterium]|nr:NAD(P)H-binding protein [Actinomycetota bacterium]
MELVTGATGYVGGRLVERLVRERRPVRATARNPARFEPVEGVEAVRADVLSGAGVPEALEGCRVAYYLVHSMEAGDEDFAARDRRAATNFARAAREAGVEKVVYLGGIAPPPGTRRSPHLASRIEVEEILLRELPRSVALRASILIGARSSSFRMLVRLVERLRFLPFPAWTVNRTAPIDERDAIEFLARAPQVAEAEGRSLDIAGPDVMTFGEMIERIAELMGVGRAPIRLGLTQTPAASAVVASVVGQPLDLVRSLMRSLETDVVPRDDEARRILGVRTRSFDRAVEHALAEWERTEALAAR